ncbi:helix-turn-helix domain-containing protein [Caulobacter segnis]|uniref:helix-turn-helix domain-containing protein n=1 Tax=Caulobacter segnis TaxID=88688 RepID=UPI00240F4FCC|nr:helix-turn-helix domain-containing protein [Caulobacter segnis]MDG2522766.1 helix-turn-helix domain-containing protein [Caulobacter segnis]
MNDEMLYEELEVPPAARGLAICYWRFRLGDDVAGPVEHVIVPDGVTSLSVAVAATGASPLLCAGPTRIAHSVQVQAGVVYGGVRLAPAAGAAVLGVHGSTLRGHIGPWVGGDNRLGGLREALVELARTGVTQAADMLLTQWAKTLSTDEAVGRAADLLIDSGGRARIADAADASGLSERQLRRRFFDVAGLTPKEFAGVRRLREACIRAVAEHETWASAAAGADYADQAHLSREVRSAFDQTPRRIAKHLRRIDHRFLG